MIERLFFFWLENSSNTLEKYFTLRQKGRNILFIFVTLNVSCIVYIHYTPPNQEDEFGILDLSSFFMSSKNSSIILSFSPSSKPFLTFEGERE